MCKRFLMFTMLLAGLGWCAGAGSDAGRAVVLEVQGAIGPAVSDFVIRGIAEAEESGAELVVLRMDTPGGLDSSMRDMIRKILASAVPVATYVAPGGARAASAGTYILYASHVAAMAPATNLGSATPVQIGPGGLPGTPDKPKLPFGEDKGKEKEQAKGGDSNKENQAEADHDAEKQAPAEPAAAPGTTMERKIINDAVAYIRGLARMRGRNEAWAEQAVREAANLTAEDALAANVIDVLAENIEDLLAQIDGREVKVSTGVRRLHTADIGVEIVEPDWRSKLLAVITNPNVAYILMLLGIYGLFFELSNPGSVLPGVIGAVCLLLALYAFQVLPINYAGLALIFLGVAFMVAEAFIPSFGALGIGGAIAFIVGSLILIDTDVSGFGLSVPLIVSLALVSAGFFVSIMTMALRQRRQPVVSGQEQMIGSLAEALDDFDGRGRVRVHGESWQARSVSPVSRGQSVRVCAMEGLVLEVEPLPEEK